MPYVISCVPPLPGWLSAVRCAAAASIRYIGDDVRFLRKASEMSPDALQQWKIARSIDDSSSSAAAPGARLVYGCVWN